ncbi:GGDEF domain-containing protein [Sphingomonas sp. CD22]|uniref:sensor domain-containing phosphodiesterase n=1 Tax=Sphingomonas sp. CD22 TaxID=3100214 RepID=UPI002ADF8DC4|nr:GGDEF domain-containing protein [Sphingomonas sp. CD22]MEA1085178.1 GGDEF domain-containing protein [Sphingomonas sp. CD22]
MNFAVQKLFLNVVLLTGAMRPLPDLSSSTGLGMSQGVLLKLQNTILEMIAKGETLASTCQLLCLEVEALLPDVICSVLTVDALGFLHPLAGPSLPEEYSLALDGVPIGPMSGSCGSAAHFGTDVSVSNIENDPRWAKYKHLALPHGLRACWSSPIRDMHGTTIATFAFYYRDRRSPTDFEQTVVASCVHLCLIAIDRHQRVIERERRAFTDALTGMANRAAFNAALADLDCRAADSWALLVVDLDNLKVVNDTFGHLAGDTLLQVAASRITSAAHPARAYRIGGDEFAIIIEAPQALVSLEETAQAILSELALPVDCGGQIVVPRATIGGAVPSAGEPSGERVRQNADFALYHAKETRRGGFVRFWPGLGSSMTRRLTAIRDVTAALRENRIDAYYQPIFRLDTREVVGLEALCRMRVGDTVVPAASFHEATTDAHVATALSAYMITLVAADVRRWLDLGIPFQHVGINVSSADLSGGTIERVLTSAFEREGVSLEHVILEITETVYMGAGDQAIQSAIRSLRARGIRVALDDFGTGFASLTHLLTVPVDVIKIDKTFIDHMGPDGVSTTIVEGLIRVAEKMNIRIVAEGVETEDQATQLTAAGCVLGQGFLVSAAVDRHQATALLLERSQHASNHPARKRSGAPG